MSPLFGPKADMAYCTAHVRFWRQSGHSVLHCICLLLTQSGHGARGAATASVCRLYGPQSNLLPELGNVEWHAALCVRLCHAHTGGAESCESNMTVVREPRLEPVAILDLRPTQITVGMREVKAKRERWR